MVDGKINPVVGIFLGRITLDMLTSRTSLLHRIIRSVKQETRKKCDSVILIPWWLMNFHPMTAKKTAEKNNFFIFENPQKGLFRRSKVSSAKFAPANFHRNKTKSERKETHSGGGAAPGGSLGRFRAWLCAPSAALCGVFMLRVVSLIPRRLACSVGVSVSFCEGMRKAARYYLRAAMRSNMDLCGF